MVSRLFLWKRSFQFLFLYDVAPPFTFLFSSGILDKNRDTFSADLNQVIAQSSCKFLLYLFDKELKMVGQLCYFTSYFHVYYYKFFVLHW